MHVIPATPAATAAAVSSIGRACRAALRGLRNAIKQYGAPYLNGPLPPL